ncbi:MAG: aminoimidazole riboside kinase [Vibrio sp.]
MNQVWVTGDAVVDLIADDESRYLKCPGGAPANVAVAIARLGGQSAFFGRVGDDPLGRFMHQTLTEEKVDTQGMRLDPAQRTSTVIVDLDAQGERSFTFMVKPSADQFTQLDDIPHFQANQWLHVCSIALANEPSRHTTFEAMKRIKAAGGYVSFDPNLREEVWGDPSEIRDVVMKAVAVADVVKFSDDELLFLTETQTIEQGLELLEPFNIACVLVTQGAKGALVVFEKTQGLIQGKAIQPIDTTGAGDAFVGGLLTYLAQQAVWQTPECIVEAVRWANACGALATTEKGAMTALPTKARLFDYLNL